MVDFVFSYTHHAYTESLRRAQINFWKEIKIKTRALIKLNYRRKKMTFGIIFDIALWVGAFIATAVIIKNIEVLVGQITWCEHPISAIVLGTLSAVVLIVLVITLGILDVWVKVWPNKCSILYATIIISGYSFAVRGIDQIVVKNQTLSDGRRSELKTFGAFLTIINGVGVIYIGLWCLIIALCCGVP